jgi:hypothetical protein
MKSINVARRDTNVINETLPLQIITVDRSPRACQFETILEEISVSFFTEEYSFLWNAATKFLGEVAPSKLTTVKKEAFKSTLDTIWEETINFAENVCEASTSYWESLSNPFCITSQKPAR